MKKAFLLILLLAMLLSGCAKEKVDTSQWSSYDELVNPGTGKLEGYIFAYNGRWGIADADGAVVLEPKLDYIEGFKGGYAVACYTDFTATPIDISGTNEYPELWGLIDCKGNVVLDFQYTHLERLAGDICRVEKDELWGLVSMNGNYIVEPKYSSIDDFVGRYAVVRVEDYSADVNNSNVAMDYYGLINDAGEELLEPIYDCIELRGDEVAATLKSEISRYTLSDGKLIAVQGGSENLITMASRQQICADPLRYRYDVLDLSGLADGEGNMLTEPLFVNIEDFCGGYAVASVYDYDATPVEGSGNLEYPRYYGVIDLEGNTVLPFEEESHISLSDDGQLVRFRQDNCYGFKNLQGEVVIEPKYESAGDFRKGYADVCIFEPGPSNVDPMSGPSGSYYFGLIDTQGREIIPLDYDSINYLPEYGSVKVSRGSRNFVFAIRDGEAVPVSKSGSDFSLEDYMPFEGSKVAKLDGEPTLGKRASLSHRHPRLDGATALFPVYSAIVEAVYPDETRYGEEEDDPLITCSKTVRAYERLVEGSADMIFVAEPSQAQLDYAAEHGVELQLTPIGSEAFVFIVNAENPLQGLSSDHIRQIYSGAIKGWSKLGARGLGEIIAYQRPANSGSQTAMEAFMGDVYLMAAPAEEVADMMDTVLEIIEYQNLPNAIGYTFRFYCTEMMQSGVKLLAVDGVEPSVENIRSGSYPVCSTLYAVTRKGEENPNVQVLLDWILSDQGMSLIEKTGYVSLR